MTLGRTGRLSSSTIWERNTISLRELWNEEFLDYLLNQVDDLYSRYRNTRIEFLLKDYRGQCTTIGKRVSVTMGKEKLTGKAYDIGPNGALVIIDDLGAKHDFFEGTLE